MDTMKFLIGATGLVQNFPMRSGSWSVWVFSILNHGRVTYGFGLYKTGVGLQGYNSISVNSVHTFNTTRLVTKIEIKWWEFGLVFGLKWLNWNFIQNDAWAHGKYAGDAGQGPAHAHSEGGDVRRALLWCGGVEGLDAASLPGPQCHFPNRLGAAELLSDWWVAAKVVERYHGKQSEWCELVLDAFFNKEDDDRATSIMAAFWSPAATKLAMPSK
jgi:hypothetical protein